MANPNKALTSDEAPKKVGMKQPPPGNALTQKTNYSSKSRKLSTPVTEIGSEGYFEGATIEGMALGMNVSYAELEYETALKWPQCLRTFGFMRNDPQIAGLHRASTMPIMRYRWYLDTDETGADPEAAKKLGEDLDLAVGLKQKKPPRIRNKNRFRFKDHMRMALQMPNIYGHMWFEQVGMIDPTDGLFHYTKLAPRLPQTITQYNLDSSGGMLGLKQNFAFAPEIPINKLVGYIVDQEGGNWIGRSPLRELHQPWVLKDRLLRVDVVRHERNGAGMPVVELPEGATRAQIAAGNKLAQMYKVGSASGGALPYGFKLSLKGVEGNTSDVLQSIKFHNQEMADAWLLMFMKLGSTETGSRALGQTFVDFFSMAQETLAIWFRDIFQEHIIEDWMDWNYGPNSPAPVLKFDKNESGHLSATDLAGLVTAGAIVLDDPLEEMLRDYYDLPQADPATARLNIPGLPVNPEGDGPMPTEPQSNTHSDPKSNTQPNGQPAGGVAPKKVAASHVPTDPTARRQFLEAAGAPHDWPFHRLMTPVEASSGADFPEINNKWQDALANLLSKWKGVTRDQIAAIVEQVRDAQTPRDLAAITAPGIGADILSNAMHSLIDAGATLARIEAARQDVHLPPVDLNALKTEAYARAQAVDQLLAKNLAQSAIAKALQSSATGGGGPVVASAVQEHLDSLTGQYAQDRLGGALTQAQNAGRAATMGGAPDNTKFYASEILDGNTCVNCDGEDGTEFSTIDEAQADYPAGGFVDCLGGDRCRGALIAVYNEDA